ncbi:MAG: tetratricopeptide repeat protein [Steroidobacteraceae bacterium]
MTRRAPYWPSGIAILALASAGALAQNKAQPTIKDLENRQVEVKKDGPSGASADKTMESYKRFLELNAGDAQLRAEALRRLGDLNLESSEAERIEHDLVTNEGLRATEAITLYSALLKAYPKYERNDAVLYQLARAYELNAQPEKALATLDQLVRSYPASRYIDEVQFRRGELLFSAKDYAGAQKAYEAVIHVGPGSSFYRQSLYKHGWSMFKLGDSEHSLASFAGVLDSVLVSRRNPTRIIEVDTLSRPDRELVEDSFRVMSITFSYGEGAKSIEEFMRTRPNKPYDYLLYARLGDLYMEKERFTDAADTYRAFVSRSPRHDKAPLLQMQAIEAYRRGGFPQLVLQGKKEYVETYGLTGPFWQGRDPKKLPQVVAQLKTNLKDVAQYYHAQAQRSKAVSDYQEAARWYRSYLTSFPDDPDSANTNYLLADTLFESRQFGDAAREYEHAAYGYGPGEKATAAGYAALVAYGKQEEQAGAGEKAAIHAQALESSLKFAATYPQHPEVPQVLTRAATDLYAAKDLARATTAAQTLLARQPPVDSGKQRVAWTVIANSSFDQEQYAQAESAYANAQNLMPANDPERAAIVERLAAAIYKQGEQKNKAGNGAGAVEDFLRVSTLAPGSKIRANADFDAAALLIEQKQWERAIGVLEGFRHNFPQSPLQADVTRKLAVAYSEGGHPGQAAAEFEQIAASPKETPEVQREAVLQAADLYEKGGNAAKSRSMLETFIKRFPAPLDPAMEARNRLATMAQKSGDIGARNVWLKDIISADRDAGAQRTDRSKNLAAHATLTLAAPLQEEFNRVRLVAPLKKSLAEKRKAMEAALKSYTQAADYQVAEVTTAATFHSAELYRQLGKDLLASERPKKLSKDELEQYDVLLEEQAFPFEEKAIKLHEVNAARTREGLFDEWVQKSFEALAKMNPGRYAKAEVSENVVEAIR